MKKTKLICLAVLLLIAGCSNGETTKESSQESLLDKAFSSETEAGESYDEETDDTDYTTISFMDNVSFNIRTEDEEDIIYDTNFNADRLDKSWVAQCVCWEGGYLDRSGEYIEVHLNYPDGTFYSGEAGGGEYLSSYEMASFDFYSLYNKDTAIYLAQAGEIGNSISSVKDAATAESLIQCFTTLGYEDDPKISNITLDSGDYLLEDGKFTAKVDFEFQLSSYSGIVVIIENKDEQVAYLAGACTDNYAFTDTQEKVLANSVEVTEQKSTLLEKYAVTDASYFLADDTLELDFHNVSDALGLNNQGHGVDSLNESNSWGSINYYTNCYTNIRFNELSNLPLYPSLEDEYKDSGTITDADGREWKWYSYDNYDIHEQLDKTLYFVSEFPLKEGEHGAVEDCTGALQVYFSHKNNNSADFGQMFMDAMKGCTLTEWE